MGTCSRYTFCLLKNKTKQKTLYIALMTNSAQYKIIIKTMKIMLKAVVVCGRLKGMRMHCFQQTTI